MVRLNKLECTINTANGVLKEFPVPPKDDNDSGTAYPLKTVYIKAEEGKEFYIEFQAHYYVPQNEPKYDHFELLVVLDGRAENSGTQLTRPLWWSKDSRLSRRSSASRTIKGRTNGSELRRFRFSVIQLTEELNGKGHIPDEKLDFLGEIKVLVSRFRADGTYSDRNGSPIMDPEDTVHEKNIKKILDKTLTTR